MDEFDQLLYAGSDQLPPDLPGEEPPKPWKRPMRHICWGLALVSFSLNIPGLDLVMSAVGMVLLWLGLRSLRRENGGFRSAYRCAAVYAVLRLTFFVLRATPLDSYLTGLAEDWWYTTQGPVSLYDVLRTVLLQTVLTLTVGGLWQGLKEVFRAAGQKPRTAAVGGLVVLEALLIPMALVGLEGWLLVGSVLLVWVLLIRNLWKLSRSLDEAGYALTPAPVRVSGGAAFALWLGIPALFIALLPLGFSRLPVNDITPVYGPSVRDEALHQNLLDLGFPEEILTKLEHDLGSEGLSMLRDAYGLAMHGYNAPHGSYYDNIPSTVMFEIPVRDERYGFHTVYLAYLRWESEDVGSGGYMEGIQVTPDWQGVSVHTTAPEGKLTWEDNGGRYHEAPLSFQFNADNFVQKWYADFSLPKEVDGPVEGWVYWELAPTYPESPTFFNYQISFAHRLTLWQYPYALPSDILASGRTSPSWRLNSQRFYLGHMAPEGQYCSDYY